MPSQVKPKLPAKPPVNATRKALLAYHSELKKYHQKLQEWDKLLQKREYELIEAREEFEAMLEEGGMGYYEDDCECDRSDAIEGCPCDSCVEWRDANALAYAAGDDTKTDYKYLPKTKKTADVGDEVDFLNKLFKLKDKRKS